VFDSKKLNPQEPEAVAAVVQGGSEVGPGYCPTRRNIDCASFAASTIQTVPEPGANCTIDRANYPPDLAGSEVAFLGINAKTEASHERRGFQPILAVPKLVDVIDQETGEITRFEETKKGLRLYRTHQELRAERYALKSVVNRLYPHSKTAKCCRMRIPLHTVRIFKTPEFQKAFYAGLIRCSRVWLCPLCAAKIAERRRAELVAAVATAKAMGWQALLMTCTLPHGLGDDIDAMLDQMLNAWRRMTTGRAGKDMRKLLGLEGTIRTLEVTDGNNGFHPHFHVLIFARSEFTSQSFQAGFLPLWQDACVKAGLPCPSDEHGLRVDDGSWAAAYATKWGLEDEMVKGHMKTTKGDKGKTPWDMLRDILKADYEIPEEALIAKRSEKRFRLYAEAFKGRRQLYWSNGLKEKLAVEEISDDDLVVMQEEHSSELAELTDDQWRAVLATKSEAALLEVAESHPWDLQTILASFQAIFAKRLK